MNRNAVPPKVLARVGAGSLNLLAATAGAVALASMLGGCGGGGPDGPDPTPTPVADRASIGYQLLRGVDRLDQPKAGVARLYSSHNPNDAANRDYNNYRRRDPDGSYVMADHTGPGVVTRIWMTARTGGQNSSPGFYSGAMLRIYIDGNTTPLLALNPNRFFSGEVFPFVAPLVGQHSNAKGFFSYVPISFTSSLKVTITDPVQPTDGYLTDELFYQINVLDLTGQGAVVASPIRASDGSTTLPPDDQPAHQQAISQWNDPLNFFNQSVAGKEQANFAGPVSGTAVLADITGPARIRGLRLHTAGISSADLERVRLRIRWDSEANPSVDIPLGTAWSSRYSRGQFQSLVQGALPDGTLYLGLPMPFRQSARLELVSPAGALPVSGEVFYSRGAVPADARYLHATFAEGRQPTGSRLLMAQASGAGHLVGLHLIVHVNSDPQALEGDEFITADGTSLYKGTGTEDYFNAHWFFEGGLRSEPLHGTTSTGTRIRPDVDTYRFMVPDLVPFASSLRFELENGNAPGNTDDYRSVAFFYLAH